MARYHWKRIWQDITPDNIDEKDAEINQLIDAGWEMMGSMHEPTEEGWKLLLVLRSELAEEAQAQPPKYSDEEFEHILYLLRELRKRVDGN